MDHRVYNSEEVLTRAVRIRRRKDVESERYLFELQDGETRELLLIALMRLRVVFSSDDALRLRVEREADIENVRVLNRRILDQLRSTEEYRVDFESRIYKDPWSDGTITAYHLDWRDVVCFDADNEPLHPPRRVHEMEMVDAVVYPRFVWMNEGYYGISYRIAQLRRREPIGLARCLFAPPTSALPTSALPTSALPIPPAPPPPPPGFRGIKSTIRIPFQTKTPVERSIRCITSSSGWKPSLDDILKCRQKLRTTK